MFILLTPSLLTSFSTERSEHPSIGGSKTWRKSQCASPPTQQSLYTQTTGCANPCGKFPSNLTQSLSLHHQYTFTHHTIESPKSVSLPPLSNTRTHSSCDRGDVTRSVPVVQPLSATMEFRASDCK